MTLKDNTTAGSIYHRTLLRLLFPVRVQKKVAHDFWYDPRIFTLSDATIFYFIISNVGY